MCGIVGGVFRQSIPAGAPDAFEAAALTLAHRGPDDRGLAAVADAHAILGFRRLSIIDLATGHQPMSTDRGQHVIFNGEIYNYQDVRRGLEGQGVRFRTTSDTEVLLHNLALRGIPGLSSLYGMWGFAYLDVPGHLLLLGRDRLGIKQLYYCMNDHGIFFASEPKSLLALPWIRREFNVEELANYLTFRCVPSPGTLFRGIAKLEPGTVLALDLGTWKAETHRYWHPPDVRAVTPMSVQASADAIEASLLTSVRRRLVADVPVAALLSGGLDSSLVVAAMRRLEHPEILTFSAVFPHFRSDESRFSRRVASRFGTRHHEQPVEADDLLGALPEWIGLNDDLVADASCLPLLLVSRLARANGCKVLLSGEGADELFAGYGSYHKFSLLRRAARVAPSLQLRHFLVRGLRAVRMLKGHDLPRVQEYFVRALPYLGTAALWGADDIERLLPLHGRYSPPRASGMSLEELGAFDFARRIPDDLLVRTDRATMGSSVEARVPFLDHELVELAFRLPPAAKALPGISKIALRMVARRWGVPLQTVAHRKVGFQVPLEQWFRHELRPLVERSLVERVVPGLDYEYVGRICNAHLRGEGNYDEMLWRLGALELWYRHWILGLEAREFLPAPASHGETQTPAHLGAA